MKDTIQETRNIYEENYGTTFQCLQEKFSPSALYVKFLKSGTYLGLMGDIILFASHTSLLILFS